MSDTATRILIAADDPAAERAVQEFVTLLRIAVAPAFDAAGDDDVPMMQSVVITAGAIFAGMSAGHMMAFGLLDQAAGDRDQAKLVAMQAFDAGVDMGLKEARLAILKSKRGGNT